MKGRGWERRGGKEVCQCALVFVCVSECYCLSVCVCVCVESVCLCVQKCFIVHVSLTETKTDDAG